MSPQVRGSVAERPERDDHPYGKLETWCNLVGNLVVLTSCRFGLFTIRNTATTLIPVLLRLDRVQLYVRVLVVFVIFFVSGKSGGALAIRLHLFSVSQF